MRILLDTGSFLVNTALGFLLADATSIVLDISDVRDIDGAGKESVPDLILVGNNFDKARSLRKFPGVRVVLLNLGLSRRRVRTAARTVRLECVLPDGMNVSGFEKLIERFEKSRL